MRRCFLISMVILFSLVPLAHAATDCEKNCCRTYSGRWDDTFDDCKSAKTGFDTCVSECEAKVWASMPQGPGPVSPENTHTCKVGFILLSLLGVAFYFGRK